MKKYLLWSLIFLLPLIQSCADLPGVQEPSEEEINAESAKAYEEVKAKSKISQHKKWNEMLNRVAKRISLASGEPFQWEWILIDSPEVNAWCMPGGKMAVYTGIMPVLKNEAALAAVLGHEVAHATRRHGKQRYARAIKSSMLGLVIGGAALVGGQILCKTEKCRMLTGLTGAAAGFAITFFDRKFSRADETDADQVGQVFMAQAGYPPSEAIALWERMGAEKGGAAPPEFISTHPSDETRKAHLSQWLPEVQKIYLAAPAQHGLGESI